VSVLPAAALGVLGDHGLRPLAQRGDHGLALLLASGPILHAMDPPIRVRGMARHVLEDGFSLVLLDHSSADLCLDTPLQRLSVKP
jgi:hypothetical protein